jgi:hypothetical protein
VHHHRSEVTHQIHLGHQLQAVEAADHLDGDRCTDVLNVAARVVVGRA